MTEDDSSKWPASAMLGYGTFGMRNPAGRRYHIRTAIALVAMLVLAAIVAMAGLRFPNNRLWLLILSLVPGIGFSYIALEFRRYILALDELARRIQLEAILWTYITGWVIATVVGGIAVVYGWEWNPLWLNPLWYVFLEPVRGCFLYFVARRY
jgi:hypothetical protein